MVSHLEVVPVKFETVRADRILEVMPALHGGLQVERQCRSSSGLKKPRSTSSRSAASSSVEDELSRESLEDTSPVILADSKTVDDSPLHMLFLKRHKQSR